MSEKAIFLQISNCFNFSNSLPKTKVLSDAGSSWVEPLCCAKNCCFVAPAKWPSIDWLKTLTGLLKGAGEWMNP